MIPLAPPLALANDLGVDFDILGPMNARRVDPAGFPQRDLVSSRLASIAGCTRVATIAAEHFV
jgi:hypothetical protein